MTTAHKIYVVGVNSEELNELQQLPEEVLRDCHLFIAAEKHHKRLATYKKKIQAVTPLQECLLAIEQSLSCGNVIVLGSGDPLFYGIGSTLLKSFATESLVFYPALTSMQRACALFTTSWHDARILSLHGRSHPHLPGLFLGQRKCLALTDPTNSPSHIARTIIDYLELIGDTESSQHLHCMVAENLGSDDERLFTGTLAETASQNFSPLNVFCLINKNTLDNREVFGLAEEDIQHSRGLITKSEIRAASLHSLLLPRIGVLWDIGGGSGSISIEAARLAPELVIYCLEQKEEEIANIKANIQRFHCYNIIPVHGNAADKMADLPAPDRVFVGGSGGKLEEIIRTAAKRLPNNGRIVVNSVLAKTARQAPLCMQKHLLEVRSTRISVLRNEGVENEQQLNPITITTGIKHE